MFDETQLLSRYGVQNVIRVKWEEYCALALSRRPVDRVGPTCRTNTPLRDRELGKVYVLQEDELVPRSAG